MLMRWIAILMMCVPAAAFARQETAEITVSHAWVRVMPPSQRVTAAFMTLENTSDKAMVLTSAETSAAGKVEMHKMAHAGGIMTMQQVDTIVIPRGETVELKPGGLHLMLFDLQSPLKEGDTVMFRLHFQDGTTATVTAEGRTPAMEHVH